MRCIRLTGLSALLLLACVSGAAAQQGRRPLSMLYPGEGMGNVFLRRNVQEVLNIVGWGEPSEVVKDEGRKQFHLIYRAQSVTFTFGYTAPPGNLKDATLAEIQIFSTAYVVAGSGVKIGDTWVPGKSTQGFCRAPQAAPGEIRCEAEGIVFVLGENNAIRSIRIVERRR